jgi:hypothetical protein
MSVKAIDYSRINLGTQMDGGIVGTCPACLRAGLAETVNGRTFYTHRVAFGFNMEGEPVVEWDMCPRIANLRTIV